MELKTYIDQEDQLNKYFTAAIVLHIGVVFFGFAFQFFLGVDWFKNRQTNNEIKVIQSSVRVDVVAMPKFTVQELKKIQVAPPSADEKEEEVKPAQDNSKDDLVFKKKGKKVNLNNLLSNLSKKKVASGKKKKVKANIKGHSKKLRKLILEGNKVSKGTATVGDSLAQEQTEFNVYVSSLPNYVRPFWKLPSYLMERDLKCRIRVYLAANGRVLRSEIYQSSGIPEFDQKAITALKQVKNFPAPKREILARVASGEVILGFPL